MMNRDTKDPASHQRWQWSTASIVVAGVALFIALGGSAVAATGLIHSKDIARGAVTSKTIKNGTIRSWDLNRKTRRSLKGARGATGATGAAGSTGSTGATGVNGSTGSAGAPGTPGNDGSDGIDGIDGTHGSDGIDGTDGTNGTDGIIAPLSATNGVVVLPAVGEPVVVVALEVPAGNYLVMAKTQLFQSGAGDSIDCWLKTGLTQGGTTLDQVAFKLGAALAEIPVSLQAVTTTSPTGFHVECDMTTAIGRADKSSLIAVPIG